MQDSLPRALPAEHQTVQNTAIWYTTLARIAAPPKRCWRTLLRSAVGPSSLELAARRMSADLCGLEGYVGELWFLWERDLMALGLNGSYAVAECPFIGSNCA